VIEECTVVAAGVLQGVCEQWQQREFAAVGTVGQSSDIGSQAASERGDGPGRAAGLQPVRGERQGMAEWAEELACQVAGRAAEGFAGGGLGAVFRSMGDGALGFFECLPGRGAGIALRRRHRGLGCGILSERKDLQRPRDGLHGSDMHASPSVGLPQRGVRQLAVGEGRGGRQDGRIGRVVEIGDEFGQGDGEEPEFARRGLRRHGVQHGRGPVPASLPFRWRHSITISETRPGRVYRFWGICMFALCLVLAAPLPPNAGDGVLLGQVVLRKLPNTPLWQRNTVPPQTVSASHIAYRVLRIEGHRLVVRNAGQEVWLDREDALRPRQAVQHFTELLQREPNNQSYLAYRGWAYREIRDFPNAIADYDELAKRYPTGSTWYNNRGSIKITAGLYDSALEDLNKSLELSSESAVAYRNRGWLYLLKNEPKLALPDFTRSIEIGPPAATSHAFRGLVHAALGQHAEADADTLEALRLEPESAPAMAARARILAISPLPGVRNPAKAVVLAEEACRQTDWRTGIQLHSLMEAYAGAGQHDAARRARAAALRDGAYAKYYEATLVERGKGWPK
jgi:tetratricopeptide (TPR) repeat protein